MASSRDKTAPRSGRRFLWLAIFIVVLFGAYSFGWFYLAGQLETRSAFLINNLADQNIQAECDSMDVRGFPFRLGVHCNSVSADDRTSGTLLSTGAFRSAAQIYKPNHIVSELDGPVTVSLAGVDTAKMDWQSLSSSTVFGLSGLTRASLKSVLLDAAIVPPNAADAVQVNAQSAEVHVRQNNADLDLALRLDDTAVTSPTGGFALPAFDAEIDLTLADRAWLLSGQQNASRNPWHDLSASLDAFRADLGQGAQLALSGPFSIDGSGFLTGKFDLEIRGRDAWQALLTEAFPEQAQTIRNATGLIASIGQSQDSLKLPLNIERGRITIGFITLGQIPPIQ